MIGLIGLFIIILSSCGNDVPNSQSHDMNNINSSLMRHQTVNGDWTDSSKHPFVVMKIGNCEYLYSNYGGEILFTHKGDCQNTIHIYKKIDIWDL